VIKEILLPDLGEGIEGAEVSEVSVTVGSEVEQNDVILVLESDKASMEIPAEISGVVEEVLVEPGEEVVTGQLLIKINEKEKNKTELLKESPISEVEPTQEVVELDSVEKQRIDTQLFSDSKSTKNTFASPGVRKLSRELEINLALIEATGPKGRVTKKDLHNFIKRQMLEPSTKTQPAKKAIDFSQWGAVETLKLTRINKITGERLQQAWQEIPHVTQHDKADITVVDTLRKKLKKEGSQKGVNVTFLPFLMKATAEVLKEMPKFNSSLDHTNENLILKNYINIGVAIDTPNGLTVPCIKGVDNKSIFELSEELMEVSKRARDKRLKPEELKGSSFTISSLGGIGGTAFTPIVNPPEVAIMGVSKSEWLQVYNKERKIFETKYIMPFSVSYDHRVIDGAAAALFTTRFGQILSKTENFL
jgi:pyruvate dehydrogenase E2 component (dihydrolipoamide acetyltransferase)